jgi:leucyl aminopeptidase
VKIAFDSATKRAGEITVCFCTKEERAKIAPMVSEGEFSGQPGAQLHLVREGLLYLGVGARAMLDAHKFRSAAGVAAMFLRKIGSPRFRVALEAWPEYAGAVVEGLVLGSYRFETFKAKPTRPLESASLQVAAGDLREAKRAVARGQTVAESANLARSIGNEPGNVLYPATLADRARKLAKDAGLKITVLDEKQLRARKFGGLLAVGGGSPRGPRLILLEHRGGAKTERPIALVGKAITFDSGGISIKPAADMEEMIFDKCGGMAVLGAMSGIARLGLKRNVIGVIASAENLPSGTAYRPGDIVTTYDGKHIEIVNTDAEGRVVLADAISYARLDCRAAAIVDLATLTGACGVALGEYAAGFWSSDERLKTRVLAAAERAGERLWLMPSFPEYAEQIKSDVALIKNSGGRLGGACTAAAFLKTFAEDTPWAHLDIACTSHRTKDRPDLARGASGFGVRTLIDLVEQWRA